MTKAILNSILFPAFFVFSSSAIFSNSAVAAPELADKILAVVNTEVVLNSDLTGLVHQLKQPEILDQALVQTIGIDKIKSSRDSQLEYLILDKIIESEIKRLNLAVTDERVSTEIREAAKENNMTSEQLMSAVKQQGLAADDYRAFLKRKIERRSLFESEIISRLRISDEDAMSEYLRKNPHSSSAINEYSVAHIFFNPKKDGGAEGAMKRAENCLSKLSAGENFEALSEKFSEDPNYTNGGFLGTFKSGEFLKEIESAIADLKVGEQTKIVKSRIGYHIVKLLSRKVTSDPKFEKEKAQIKAELMEASFSRQFKSWIQSKREDGFIKIND